MSWSRFSPTLHKGIAKSRPLDRTFRRQLREPRAFTFWHIWTSNWLLGIWSKRFGEKGLHEFRVLNHDPGMRDGPIVDPERLQEIRGDWMHPSDFSEDLKRMKSEELDKQVAQFEHDEEIIHMKQCERKRLNNVQRDDPYWMGHSERRKAW